MQDKGMRISKSVDVYSDQEYPSLKASLAGVSENIAATQDLLGAQVKAVIDLYFSRSLIIISLLEPINQQLYTTSRESVWIPNKKLDASLLRFGYHTQRSTDSKKNHVMH